MTGLHLPKTCSTDTRSPFLHRTRCFCNFTTNLLYLNRCLLCWICWCLCFMTKHMNIKFSCVIAKYRRIKQYNKTLKHFKIFSFLNSLIRITVFLSITDIVQKILSYLLKVVFIIPKKNWEKHFTSGKRIKVYGFCFTSQKTFSDWIKSSSCSVF